MATDRTAGVLAVDGGASKTDVALLDADGNVEAAVRVYRSAHLGVGRDDNVESLEAVIASAAAAAGRQRKGDYAATGVYCLAGVDLALDERRVQRILEGRGWTRDTLVRNDTFAVLRAGSERGWGIAVVCGAGMNCVGVAADGRTVRFPSLGEISGDLASGGGWLGVAAVGATMRAEDGRGPRTLLEELVPEHFRLTGPTAVMEAFYVGDLEQDRTLELAPVVFQAAQAGDAVARALLDSLADEVLAMVLATIRRLDLQAEPFELVLGGGIFRNPDVGFRGRIEAAVKAAAPRVEIKMLASPPVLGAALLGLDQLGAADAAKARARSTLTYARLDASTGATGPDGHHEEGGQAWRA